ncbi:hypothetical protein MTR_8g464250 [Medicago truncatula]|uniref:Uncharacterized protein n=1 Tax=Medicago truncatula TaxID=3880 RepID=A0A072TPY5_MEDTR|nr:hypothetical protein MTR_8g464250 [Medicago truncatula]
MCPPPIPNIASSNTTTASGTTTNPPVPPVPPGVIQSSQTRHYDNSNRVCIYSSGKYYGRTNFPGHSNEYYGRFDFSGHSSGFDGHANFAGDGKCIVPRILESWHGSYDDIRIPFGTPQQSFTPFGSPQLSLTNASFSTLRQKMEETNHEMVNLVTQQVGTVINPLIRDTNNSYQAISLQMERISNFLGAPPVRITPVPQNVDQVLENQAHEVQPEIPEELVRAPIIVNRHQNAYQVVMQARRNNYEGQNNIANVVEALLAQNGFNMGLHRPNFVSALSEYVLEIDLPRNTKIPKFTKFAGEILKSPSSLILKKGERFG